MLSGVRLISVYSGCIWNSRQFSSSSFSFDAKIKIFILVQVIRFQGFHLELQSRQAVKFEIEAYIESLSDLDSISSASPKVVTQNFYDTILCLNIFSQKMQSKVPGVHDGVWPSSVICCPTNYDAMNAVAVTFRPISAQLPQDRGRIPWLELDCVWVDYCFSVGPFHVQGINQLLTAYTPANTGSYFACIFNIFDAWNL
jgi:hypothetical protein